MDLTTFLGRLKHVKGPNASGNYTACCPGHDDKTASLGITLKEGREGKLKIMLRCYAGCETQHVLDCMGLTFNDLVVDPDPPRGSDSAPRAKTGQKPPKPADPPFEPDSRVVPGAQVHTVKPKEEDAPKVDWEHPDRVYSYTDEKGAELFQVVRYHFTNAKGKTFIQRTHKPGDPKARRDGYVYSVAPEIRSRALYRLPRVLKAIREGKPVYVVEGEKDVETMERLGHTATCNPGGAGKWHEGHTARLQGADVIILPDCDTEANGYTGQNHAWQVAMQLQGVAARIRLVDIKEACAELPDKGDISDMVEILGDVPAMDALARQVAATPDFSPDMLPFWLSPMEQAAKLYEAVDGYMIVDGCIAQKTSDGHKALTDFAVIPRAQLTRDDGVTSSLYFTLDGWNSRGKRLGRVTIPSASLESMNWVREKWGYDANLAPGSTTKGKVAWVIGKVGQMTAKRVTEYNHTGWRKIRGKWVYLYHGGAVGMEGVTVDMGDNTLKTYRLDGSGVPGFDQIAPVEAAKASLRLQNVMALKVGVPLLGVMYLAPLREFMIQTDIMPAFALFLHGTTGTHKSTAAALALSHYGNFHSHNAPANFHDTGNQIRTKAFLLKDAPILVDDFHPVSSVQEKRQMAATAQALSRAFGDGADRGRLNADSSIRASKPPRSVAVISGEDLPAIGESGLARFFIVDIEGDDIKVTKELTELQEEARKGVLQKAMRGYIEWLAERTDKLPEKLHELFLEYRADARSGEAGAHDRAPEAVACILIGYRMMLEYMHEVGAVNAETAQALLQIARGVLMDASLKQTREMESEKPHRIFLDMMGELLVSRRVGVKDLRDPEDPGPRPPVRMVGYVDGEYYYLQPGVAYAAVQMLCREQGTEFPVTPRALNKHLLAAGIVRGDENGKTATRNKWVDGRAQRLLWIPMYRIGGVERNATQVSMDQLEAVDTEIPPEWR